MNNRVWAFVYALLEHLGKHAFERGKKHKASDTEPTFKISAADKMRLNTELEKVVDSTKRRT